MGIASISKKESEVPSEKALRKNHNEYNGNRVAAHTDSPREGEVIITLQSTEAIIFYLKNYCDVVKESIVGPGSGYVIRCPKHHSHNVASKTGPCDMKLCPRHGLYHVIECDQLTKCRFHHDANSATTKPGAQKSP